MNFNTLSKYSLNQYDIYKILGKSIKIMEFKEFKNYNDILSCFGSSSVIIIFFETELGNIGHWECLILNRNNKYLSFFDSYGIDCKDIISHVQKNLLIDMAENGNYIYNLLLDFSNNNSDWKIVQNKIKYQKFGSSKNPIDTCGRHVCVRSSLHSLDEIEYFKFMTDYKQQFNLNNFDDVVIQITYKIIHK